MIISFPGFLDVSKEVQEVKKPHSLAALHSQRSQKQNVSPLHHYANAQSDTSRSWGKEEEEEGELRGPEAETEQQ